MKPAYNGYQLKVMRDTHPTNPLDMCDAPIKTFTATRHHGATSAEQHLIYALSQEASRFGDYLYDHHLQWGRYYDLADLVPAGVDWHLLSGCHPDDAPASNHTAEAADNAALLQWAGVQPTRENVYSDTLPDVVVCAMYNHLRNNVVHVETVDMEKYTVYLWAERTAMSEYSGNQTEDIKSFAAEYRAFIEGDVWGYTLTPALYDDDDELVEVDSADAQDSCFGFYGTQTTCITHALPQFAADALAAHCGEWIEECTINIYEVPDGAGV